MTSRDLLIATHRGDKDAAVRLYRVMAPRLLAYARALLGHDAAAEDAVQQVFVSLFARRREEIEIVQDVPAWLIRLTRNAALNQARTHQRRRARETALIRANDARHTGSHHSDDDLLAAVSMLPDDARELILLKHVAGLTFDQMSVSLDQNRSTVASRYRVALDLLRAAIARPQGVHHG